MFNLMSVRLIIVDHSQSNTYSNWPNQGYNFSKWHGDTNHSMPAYNDVIMMVPLMACVLFTGTKIPGHICPNGESWVAHSY